MRRKQAVLVVCCSLVMVRNVFAQQSNAESAARVMRAVAERVAPQSTRAVATIVAVSRVCDAVQEVGICDGSSYKPQAQTALLNAAQYLADAEKVSLSSDATADALKFLNAPVFENGNARFRFCDAGPYVLTLKTSVVRETKAGSEWRAIVWVNQDPVRGECFGGGTKIDFVVVKDANSAEFRVRDAIVMGHGDGHLYPKK